MQTKAVDDSSKLDDSSKYIDNSLPIISNIQWYAWNYIIDIINIATYYSRCYIYLQLQECQIYSYTKKLEIKSRRI